VIIRPRRQFVEVGDTAKFRVSFDGQPTPSVVWQRMGTQLKPSDKYAMYEVNGCHVLEISDVTEADEGGYACVISNAFGSETCQADLAIFGSSRATGCSLMSAPVTAAAQQQRVFSVQPFRRRSDVTPLSLTSRFSLTSSSPAADVTSSSSFDEKLAWSGRRRLTPPTLPAAPTTTTTTTRGSVASSTSASGNPLPPDVDEIAAEKATVESGVVLPPARHETVVTSTDATRNSVAGKL
jgi:hypothetical protein